MNFDLLDSIRKEKRYTVTSFCDAIGVNISTYYRWKAEPSRMDGMPLSTANNIVKVLKLTQKQWKQLN